MIEAVWGLFSVFTNVWLGTAVHAITPVPLALPQDTNYAQYVSEQLTQANFSTDPRGRVAAQVDPDNAIGGQPPLRVFITNNQTCTRGSDNLSYHITVRNYGTAVAGNLTIQVVYPLGTSYLNAFPAPLGDPRDFPADRTLEWKTGGVPPGGTFDVSFIIVNDADLRSVAIPVSVFFTNGQVFTRHVIDGPCTNQLAPFQQPSPGATPKKPAILCHPAEVGCTPTFQSLGLGTNYQQALTDPSKGPAFFSETGVAKLPDLGERFDEAIADIIPGDCRVIPDEIIETPQFHDALNRRAKPASFYMEPLRQSGEDFRRLVLENAILGIDNQKNARSILEDIHRKHWEKQIDPIEDILRSSTPDDPSPAGATAYVRSVYLDWDDEWVKETREAQEGRDTDAKPAGLLRVYGDLQEQREQKFDPVATKAVNNAKESIRRACGRQNDDAGLTANLIFAKLQYSLRLAGRAQAYDQMQKRFRDPNNAIYPPRNRANQWQQDLKAALDAFDNDNPEPLKAYLSSIAVRDQEGFAAAWRLTYEQHAGEDEAADNQFRLQRWETALDTPKTAATACERENVFPPYVSTTWCESGSEPAVIIQEAPQPNRLPKLPPLPILGGQQAQIRPELVRGTPCGGGLGDPFWAADCSCDCDQLVPTGGSIRFCQVAQPITISRDTTTTDSDGQRLPPRPAPGSFRPITRHDNQVFTREECLWDGVKHQDPFF